MCSLRPHSSQEPTKPAQFIYQSCGHEDHADHNASLVIKKRAIELIKHPGAGLSKRGVLRLDTGRGAMSKTIKARALVASGSESSKKKKTAALAA